MVEGGEISAGFNKAIVAIAPMTATAATQPTNVFRDLRLITKKRESHALQR